MQSRRNDNRGNGQSQDRSQGRSFDRGNSDYRSQDNSDRWSADRADSDSFSSYDRMDRSRRDERSQQGGAQSQYDRQNNSSWEDHSADYRTPTDSRSSYQGFSNRDREPRFGDSSSVRDSDMSANSERGYNEGRRIEGGFSSSGRSWSGDTERGPYNGTSSSRGDWASRTEVDRANQYGDTYRASHYGKGPKGFKRSDDRIKEEISEVLTRHHEIDASDIEVEVKEGDVTLSGVVPERTMKHLTEDIVERCMGVHDITNNLRVKRDGDMEASNSSSTGAKNSSAKKSTGSSTSTPGGNH